LREWAAGVRGWSKIMEPAWPYMTAEGKYSGYSKYGNKQWPKWCPDTDLCVLCRKTDMAGDKDKMYSKQVGGDHYTRLTIQPWQVVDAWGLDFYLGNVVKYIARDKGNRLEDLKKAAHYLEHEIALMELKESQKA
jgi:hypothetical protein